MELKYFHTQVNLLPLFLLHLELGIGVNYYAKHFLMLLKVFLLLKQFIMLILFLILTLNKPKGRYSINQKVFNLNYFILATLLILCMHHFSPCFRKNSAEVIHSIFIQWTAGLINLKIETVVLK